MSASRPRAYRLTSLLSAASLAACLLMSACDQSPDPKDTLLDTEEIDIFIDENTATDADEPDRGIAAQVSKFTYIDEQRNKRVTFRQPRSRRIDKPTSNAADWKLDVDYVAVICFIDGVSAIFFTVGDKFYAANGSSRGFVGMPKGNGMVLADGQILPIAEFAQGEHLSVVAKVIDEGLTMCRSKTVDEKLDAIEMAIDE